MNIEIPIPPFYLIILALQHPKWMWRSTASIAKETGISESDVLFHLNDFKTGGQVVKRDQGTPDCPNVYWGWKSRVELDKRQNCPHCGQLMPITFPNEIKINVDHREEKPGTF